MMVLTILRNIAAALLLLLLPLSCNSGTPKVKETAPDPFRVMMAKQAAFSDSMQKAPIVVYRDYTAGHGSSCDCKYDCEAPVFLVFKDRKLMREEKAPPWDSARISSYLEKLNSSQDSLLYIYRHPRCPKHSPRGERSEILIPGGHGAGHYTVGLYRGFFSGTVDDILWNDTLFLSSDSPLSVFEERYRFIYSPDVEELRRPEPNKISPKALDKSYIAKWTIIDGMLYLYDIDFAYAEGGKEAVDAEVYRNRFQPVEQLTGEKLQKIPLSDKQGIPARWYSGTLFFKRHPVENEPYFVCGYDCEPFYRVDFENGKVTSINRVRYMADMAGRIEY